MSHYMQNVDGMSDIIANQYYGNMDVLRESANRQPRPINSTLPLFSPSVISGRRISRVRSSNGSDTSANRQNTHVPGHEAVSYAGAGSTSLLDGTGVPADARPGAVYKNRSTSAIALTETQTGEELGTAEQGARMHRRKTDTGVVAGIQEPLQEDLQEDMLADKSIAEAEPEAARTSSKSSVVLSEMGTSEPALASEDKAESRAADDEGASNVSIDMPPDTQDATALESLRRASTGSLRAKDGQDKICALNLLPESRPGSQARLRRNKDMGTTQYKPANATGKSAVARGAPGLSYMFSPQIGPSRPSSVIGITTPSHHQHIPSALRAAEGFVAEPSRRVSSPVCSPNETKTPTPADNSQDGAANATDNMDQGARVAPEMDAGPDSSVFIQAPERKPHGSINIDALERFLDEGEIPTSSSDDELSADEDDDFGWEEDYVVSEPSSSRYHSHRSSYSSAQRVGASLQQANRPSASYPWRRSQQPDYDLGSIKKTSPSRGGGGGLGISSSLKAPRNPVSNQYPPYLHGAADGQSIAENERTPLLRSKDNSAPPQYSNESSRFIVPADLLNINSFDGRYPSTQNSAGMENVAMLERHMRRTRKSRREQKHHEELFIDKNGFIDESYRFTFFNPEIGTIRAQEFADLRTPTMDLADLLQAGGCFWIDVFRPSLQEMHLISKIFRIHALNVEDIMTQDSREKCEIHANYYFVCFRSFDSNHNSEAYLEPKCIYNIVLREGIITFHMEPSVHQYHVLRRIRRQIDHIVVTPDWLNYAIIDDITDLLAPIMQMIEFEVDAIDELVLVISSSEQSDMLLRISNVRKKIMMVMRLLHGKSDVVRALIKRFESATAISASQMNAMAGGTAAATNAAAAAAAAAATVGGNNTWGDSPRHRASNNDSMWMYSAEVPDPAMEVAIDQRKGHETILYLGDVLDHILTMLQNAAHYDNVLSRAQANYLAQISIELTESSNRTNDVVAKLSALAAIVVPLNFITGMWGANVKVPGQDYDDLQYFFTILGMCMLYVVAAVCWARYCKIF
ncbi:CorA metal ion transporter [Coemansia sp. RSA 2559]|nr:CorA metal ion transporter [Coemansia sp. RSA 2559]